MKNFCEQCRAKLREGAAFCGKCGASTGMQNKIDKGKKTGKKAVIISTAVAVAVLVVAVIAAVPYLRSDTYQCKKNMKLAQKSYKAGKYEEALSYCKETLALDESFVDAYLKSADIYLEMEEYLSAVQVLVDGGKKTGDETLKEREEYLREHIVVIYKKYHSDGGLIIENTYDEYGNEIKNANYNGDGSVKWQEEFEYEYDEFGNPIKLTHYDSDGNVDYWGEGEADESGNLIKWVLYDCESGYVIKWREWEYDKFGNPIKKIYRVDDESITAYYEYEYDEFGNLIKEVGYDMDGSIESWDEWEYDKSGNLIKQVIYNHGSISHVEYDESGNEIEHVSHTERQEFEYDEFGNMIKETSGWIDDISEEWWYEYDEYIYDELGNLIKKEHHSSDGNVTGWSEYEYDRFGNQIESEYRSRDGSVEILSESKYDIMGNNTDRSKKYGDYDSIDEYEYQYTYISEEIRRKRDVLSKMW